MICRGCGRGCAGVGDRSEPSLRLKPSPQGRDSALACCPASLRWWCSVSVEALCVRSSSLLCLLSHPHPSCPPCLQHYPASDRLTHPIAATLSGLRHLSAEFPQLRPGWSPCLHLAPLSILHTTTPVSHSMSPLPQNPPVAAPHTEQKPESSLQMSGAPLGPLPAPLPLHTPIQPHGSLLAVSPTLPTFL